MNALLDTHIWIWLLEDPSKIAQPAMRQLEMADTLTLSGIDLGDRSQDRAGKLFDEGDSRSST